MPDVYRRTIEPVIAIILDTVRGSERPPPSPPRYRCPPWTFLLRRGPPAATQAAFCVATHSVRLDRPAQAIANKAGGVAPPVFPLIEPRVAAPVINVYCHSWLRGARLEKHRRSPDAVLARGPARVQ